MHRLVKTFGIFSLSIFILASFAGPAFAQDQWGFGPVLVFSARNGGGSVASFDVGEYRADRNQFGQLRNDSAFSVMVPTGYRVRFCENEGNSGQGGGRCEEVTEGNHNLQYPGMASYIRVWGRSSDNSRGNWNGGGERGVTVYEDRDSHGRSQDFSVGRYLALSNDLGSLRNDRASSVTVSKGFRVRLCENEGDNGRGSGSCEEYGDGRFNLRYNDMASFIEVRRTSGWGGGGWDGNPGGGRDGDPGGWNPGGDNNWDRNQVTVFADPNQRGTRQQFSVGTFRFDAGQFGSLKNDSASSVFVPSNYKIRLCENEGRNTSKGQCEEYGPGSFNLRYNDIASYIEVRRGNDRWESDGGWNGGGPGFGGGGVIVYVDAFQRGVSQEFREGSYRFVDHQFGRLPNDAASSILVPPGFRVKLCENEGTGKKGERCEEYGPGTYNLAHNDMASSIFVSRN